MINSFRENYKKQRDIEDLRFYRKKLCSVKQFVGEGKLFIDKKTTTFNSESVVVVVTREDEETYFLLCDYQISNGIKTGEIDEEFLLYEEFKIEGERPHFWINCSISYEDNNYSIFLDQSYSAFDYRLDFRPFEYPDDKRFSNKNFKLLCRIADYIDKDGGFYQNRQDIREFVITRFKNDPSPVRLLCSNKIEFLLINGKNPKDLLEHYIAIYVNENDEEYLRIFDKNSITSESWHRRDSLYFIIDQVLKKPFQYSFINVPFNTMDYLKIK